MLDTKDLKRASSLTGTLRITIKKMNVSNVKVVKRNTIVYVTKVKEDDNA
jgi:hypothetical protein